MTDTHNRAAAMVVVAISETIREMGEHGAPLGIMYAALMGKVSYESFMSVIEALVKAGVIVVENNCAYVVTK